MDKLIIKNEDEIILREYEQYDNEQIERQNQSFAEYFGIEQKAYTPKEIDDATIAFNDIFDGTSIVTRENTLDTLYRSLLTAEKKEDIDKVLKMVRGAYVESPVCKKAKFVANYDHKLETQYDLMASIAVKKIFYTYWLKKLLSYKQNITDIEYAKCKGRNVEELLKMVDEEIPKQASANKTREINERIFLDTIDYAFFKYQEKLCSRCQHLLKCQRTLDILSKDYLDESYQFPDFITQSFIHEYEDSTCNEYLVQRCDNFKKSQQQENPSRRRELSETLYDFYTSGSNVTYSSEPLQYYKKPSKKTSY